MIKAIFYREKDESYKGFCISGHAMFDKFGKDIVCSSVSALAINAVNSIEELTENKYEIDAEEAGTLKFKFLSGSDEKGQLLLESLALGLIGIEEEYGSKYLRVNFKEV